MSPSELLERELRAAKPAAPETLRERVRTIAAQEPEREPFLRRLSRTLSARRFVLVAAPATAVAALAAATVIGLTDSGTPDDRLAGAGEAASTTSLEAQTREAAPAQEDAQDSSAVAPSPGALPPTDGRLQRYDAQLQLRVDGIDELSAATQRAMRITRSVGGSVASVSYDAPSEGIGSAQLTLRVPVERVQSAIVQLSGLGTILAQRYGIEDLQPAADELAKQIEETQARIAQTNEQLGNPDLSAAQRAVLRARLAEAQRQLRDLRSGLTNMRAEARLATIQLGLTTQEILPVPEDEEKGALDRVVDILRWEGIALLYVAVVAGPFVLLGLAVWLLLRLRRRREEARLLAQT